MTEKASATFTYLANVKPAPCGFCDGDTQEIVAAIRVDVGATRYGWPGDVNYSWPICADCLAAPTIRLWEDGHLRPNVEHGLKLRAWGYALRHLVENRHWPPGVGAP